MHNLNPNHVGKTLATTVGILYIVCAIAYVILPSLTKASFVYMMHGLNIEPLLTSIQFFPTVIGLLVSIMYSYIAGALFAYLWNKLAK
ncbi:hypothetical protein HY625_00460 [Candidatus Uhrbacteria bacterium]|nr:hypothetical protein [Candidatus Uhrbacteria bacterium]